MVIDGRSIYRKDIGRVPSCYAYVSNSGLLLTSLGFLSKTFISYNQKIKCMCYMTKDSQDTSASNFPEMSAFI